MCGIAGFITKQPLLDAQMLQNAGNAMKHRGPDHQGIYLEDSNTFGLVHQRLSILDLDPRANQPMFSLDKRYIIVYNGEVYNYKELRLCLIKDGIQFRTNGDTEVILNLFLKKGEACLEELNGMFAFAIWDTKERRLFIARDRLGIKPLHYTLTDSYFAFTSDLKVFQEISFIGKRLSKESIWQFLFFGYVPQPSTIFENVYKLLPGHTMTIDGQLRCSKTKYWDLDLNTKKQPTKNKDIIEKFYALFQQSVQRRLVSDVEVGAFLSGGLDSSSIVASMNRPDSKCFTIGFNFQSNTLDLKRAKELSQHLNLQQIENIIDEKSVWDFYDFLKIMDEPISESSILSLLFNYKIAKKNNIKVILSGDGADELLGGYGYFRAIDRFRKWENVPKGFWKGAYSLTDLFFSGIKANSRPGKFRDIYIRKTLTSLLQNDVSSCHQLILSQNNFDDLRKLSTGNLRGIRDSFMDELYHGQNADLHRILAIESKSALVNKHLTKVDKASMANSVEARVPFLDHELVEFVFSLPGKFKTGKSILKQAMRGRVPDSIINDRKRGFNLPMKSWVRSYIVKDEKLIDIDGIESLGILSRKAYFDMVKNFNRGKTDHSRTIWSLFVLSGWLNSNKYSVI